MSTSPRAVCVAVIGFLSFLNLTGAARAQGPVPFDTNPDWTSYASGVTTGGAFVDLNLDQRLDMVVANGNDIRRQRVEVFYNQGGGQFPANPDWQSSDVDYHGHLSVGDVNQDGWPDVAVSVFLGPGGFGSLGHVKLYLNDGTGFLSGAPSWRSSDTFYSFSCDLGDADGDGDLDLAVATGEPYYGAPDTNRIYYNQGGALETTPSWVTSGPDHSLDVAFGDADGDGDLDVAFCQADGRNVVYLQTAGSMGTTAGWASTDTSTQNGNTLFFRDLDRDGALELLVTDNDQLSGGAGVFKAYANLGGGLATTPFWSVYGGYTSAITAADLHRDGYPDVLSGLWWGGSKAFLNNAGSISTGADWSTASASVVEAMFLGDVNGDAVRTVYDETHAGDGVRRTFYLQEAPVHRLISVRVDGQVLPTGAFSLDAEDGWIALDRAPATDLGVTYLYSESLDLGVTNWDQSKGNYVFLRHPLVDMVLTPPPSPILNEGDSLAFQVDLTSTLNRTEPVLYAAFLFPPVGGALLVDFRKKSFGPFATMSFPYSYTIPYGLPAAWKGDYLFAAYVRAGKKISEQDTFTFKIQ